MTDKVRVEVRRISGDRILLQVDDRWHLVLTPLGAEDLGFMLLASVQTDENQDPLMIEDAQWPT